MEAIIHPPLATSVPVPAQCDGYMCAYFSRSLNVKQFTANGIFVDSLNGFRAQKSLLNTGSCARGLKTALHGLSATFSVLTSVIASRMLLPRFSSSATAFATSFSRSSTALARRDWNDVQRARLGVAAGMGLLVPLGPARRPERGDRSWGDIKKAVRSAATCDDNICAQNMMPRNRAHGEREKHSILSGILGADLALGKSKYRLQIRINNRGLKKVPKIKIKLLKRPIKKGWVPKRRK